MPQQRMPKESSTLQGEEDLQQTYDSTSSRIVDRADEEEGDGSNDSRQVTSPTTAVGNRRQQQHEHAAITAMSLIQDTSTTATNASSNICCCPTSLGDDAGPLRSSSRDRTALLLEVIDEVLFTLREDEVLDHDHASTSNPLAWVQ